MHLSAGYVTRYIIAILQKLSNELSYELFYKMTPYDVRNWLLNCMRDSKNVRLVFIVDNLLSTQSDIWKDIYELIDLNRSSSYSVLLVMNEFIFDIMKTIPGRTTTTAIGKAFTIYMSPLTNNEFSKTVEIFNNEYGVYFHNGAQFNTGYRAPRFLRTLLAQIEKHTSLKKETKTRIMLPSTTRFDVLLYVWENIVVDKMLQSDCRCFAKAVIKEKVLRNNDPLLCLIFHGKGAITLETAESHLGIERLKRMESLGFVQQYNLNDGKSYLIFKCPEAISVAVSFIIKEGMEKLYRQKKEEQLYEYLIETSQMFPYSDLVAMIVIWKICHNNSDILSLLIYKLLDDEPAVEETPDYGRFALFVEEGIEPINLEGDIGGILLSNVFPWLVLSQIAALPIGDQNGDRSIQLELLYRVGSFKNVLFSIDNKPLKEMQRFQVYDLSRDSCVLCGKMGVVEPITYAMQRGFYEMPNEMLRLVKVACEDGNECLINRLLIAAKSTIDCKDNIVCNSAKECINLLSPKIKDFHQ